MKIILKREACLSKEELQAYVAGNLDSAKRFRVENHLNDCLLCSQAIEGIQADTNLDEHLQTLYYQPKNKGLSWLWLTSFLLLNILFFYFIHQNNQRQKLEHIIDTYIATPPIALQRTDNSTTTIQINEYIQKGKFEIALHQLQTYVKEKPDGNSYLSIAYCYLQLNEMSAALKFLDRVESDYPLLKEDAYWLKSILFLKRGEEEKAKIFLADLSSRTNGKYPTLAKQFLEDIK